MLYANRCARLTFFVIPLHSAMLTTLPPNKPRATRTCIARLCTWIGASLALLACISTEATTRNDEIFMYRGADREQRLLEKARQEGTLTLYTSLAPTESKPLAEAFEKKYGVKVELWRALSDKVVQRAVTEARGKRFAVDVIETNGPEMEMLAREKLLSEFHSPHIADLPTAAIPSHRLYMPDRMNFFVVAFNTNKVKKADLPASYLGFLDPKWKGRIGIEATDAEWMATLVKKWGNDAGMSYFRDLAKMRPDVRKGHVLLAELVASGEVQVALTIYNANAETLKRKGAPIDWVPMEPVAGRPQGIGLAKNAPHPYAAMLFADYVLSPEGQELFNSMGRVPASAKVKNLMNNFAFELIESATVLDESAKWNKLWDELFIAR